MRLFFAFKFYYLIDGEHHVVGVHILKPATQELGRLLADGFVLFFKQVAEIRDQRVFHDVARELYRT